PCFDPRDSLSPSSASLLIPGTRSPPVLARLILSHPRDSRQPPALVFPPPGTRLTHRHSRHSSTHLPPPRFGLLRLTLPPVLCVRAR
ncbi:hypothetical protein C0993_005772, partial [Termitomyces sp. T159_Od127]